MSMPRRGNMAASVRQRLLNRSREQREDFGLLLTRYGIERLLYRLGASEYGTAFILKGAMLFPLWGLDEHRPTRDVDLLAFGGNSEGHLVEVFREVCRVGVEDDGLVFVTDSVRAEAIREEMEYGGIRVKLVATLDGARIPLQIDVGFGDVVTPAAAEVVYPSLFDLPAPQLRVYPRETVVAEKFQAMVHLAMANSRMKDFYDIWMLAHLFEFDGNTLARAVAATFERRRTAVPVRAPLALTAEFYDDAGKQAQWRAFLRRNNFAEPNASFETVARALETFLLPPSIAIRQGVRFVLRWPMGGPWQ